MTSRQPFGDPMGSIYQRDSVEPPVSRILRRESRKSAHISFIALTAADLLAFIIAWSVGNAIATGDIHFPILHATGAVPTPNWGLSEIGLIFAIFCVSIGNRGHYTQRVPAWTEIRDVITTWLFVVVCDYVLLTGIYNAPFTISFVIRWVVLIPLILTGRNLTRAGLRVTNFWTLRTVFVGDAASSQRVSRALESDLSLGYRVVGDIPLEVVRDHSSPAELHALLNSYHADFLAIATGLDGPAEMNIVAVLDRARIPFALVPTTELLPVHYGRPQYFFSHNVAMFTSQQSLGEPISRATKIAFDFVLATLLILMASPALIAIAIAIRLEGGPALFRHKRIGENGRIFGCIKFRSMKTNGDQVLAELLAKDPVAAAEWASTRKLRNDPRITKIGRFLRKTSLDELPQLFNILRGEMSFVGPRPIVQSEIAFYGDDMDYYYKARPGLTGLWQVTGRSNTSYARRVQLDVWYVKNWTLWHDIAILLKTIPAVLLREGAH